MNSHNWEDWGFVLSLAAAVALAVGLSTSHAPNFASAAIAAEQPAKYAMTITAKRWPAECKGLVGNLIPAHCAALIDAQTVSVREAP